MSKSSRPKGTASRTDGKRAQAKIDKIRTAVAALDYVCTGTLLQRRKSCGKPTCACATSPKARHGPYYEWTRREGDRLAHTVLQHAAVPTMRKAIANNRRLRKLIRAWERQSLRVALATEDE